MDIRTNISVYEILALAIAGVSIVISIISAMASCKSASASKKSSDVAKDVLNLERKKAEEEQINREQDRAIEISKRHSGDWKRGIMALVETKLKDRRDFPEICKPILIINGVSTKNMKAVFEELQKIKYIAEIQKHWEFD